MAAQVDAGEHAAFIVRIHNAYLQRCRSEVYREWVADALSRSSARFLKKVAADDLASASKVLRLRRVR